jgi:hypothetical protein
MSLLDFTQIDQRLGKMMMHVTKIQSLSFRPTMRQDNLFI